MGRTRVVPDRLHGLSCKAAARSAGGIRALEEAKAHGNARAITPLRREDVLIIGSGQTFPNMRGFAMGTAHPDVKAEAFDTWRRIQLADPVSRQCHVDFHGHAFGKPISGFRFGNLLDGDSHD